MVVPHSEKELDATKATLDKAAEAAGKDIYSWHVDVAASTVVVSAADSDAAQSFVKSSAVDSDAVKIAVGEAPKPLYDIRGGDQYVINGNTLCSVGFAVNNGGFVTAGHCGGHRQPHPRLQQRRQGTFAGSSFPGNDYAWVRTNADWTPRAVGEQLRRGQRSVAGSREAWSAAPSAAPGRDDRLALRRHPGQERDRQLRAGRGLRAHPHQRLRRRRRLRRRLAHRRPGPRASPPAAPATAPPAATRSSSRSTRSSAPTA